MIIVLRNKETDKVIDEIEIEDKIMLKAFISASEAYMTFNAWFNKCIKNYIKANKKK